MLLAFAEGANEGLSLRKVGSNEGRIDGVSVMVAASFGANVGSLLPYFVEGAVEGLSVLPGIPGTYASSEGPGLNDGVEGMFNCEGDVIGV